VVSITPRPRFTPGERAPGTHCMGGWVGPRSGLDAEVRGKNFCLCQGSNPGRPVRSQTLYWLGYPGTRSYNLSRSLCRALFTLEETLWKFKTGRMNVIFPFKLVIQHLFRAFIALVLPAEGCLAAPGIELGTGVSGKEGPLRTWNISDCDCVIWRCLVYRLWLTDISVLAGLSVSPPLPPPPPQAGQ
jgi:hypothetical protein